MNDPRPYADDWSVELREGTLGPIVEASRRNGDDPIPSRIYSERGEERLPMIGVAIVLAVLFAVSAGIALAILL